MPKTKIYNYICKNNYDKCLFIITIIMKFIFKPKKKKSYYYIMLKFSMHCTNYRLVCIYIQSKIVESPSIQIPG